MNGIPAPDVNNADGHLGPDIAANWHAHNQHTLHYNTFQPTHHHHQPRQRRVRQDPMDRVVAGFSGVVCLCFLIFVLYKMISFSLPWQ
ncbi:actin-like protein 4 [Apiospora arundinis]